MTPESSEVSAASVPETDSWLPLEPFYEPDGGEPWPPPGAYPFVRGVRPDGYRSRLWTMRQ
ncbi:MAG: methylmalonyl-CoA mutase family protein, partial [Candidatus Dormibacteria bacterium]